MRENGARLMGKNANFGGFAVLRNPIIDPHIMGSKKSNGAK